MSVLGENAYPCSCSRKQLQSAKTGKFGYIYPGYCRKRPLEPEKPQFSYRLNTQQSGEICFTDKVQGNYCQQIENEVGDFILKRTDGLFAYQLAVVADDEDQGITHIVRGYDLLDNTPRQIYLQRKLGFSTPEYAHFPVATYESGKKLSKQNKAPSLASDDSLLLIYNTLLFLGQHPPLITDFSSLEDLWQWSISHWKLSNIPSQQSIISSHFTV
jgi:glutamyl-Q tRNA(Asp) synthetase